MKTISISGTPRTTKGKHEAILMRKTGNVPCVLYGGKEQMSFSVPEKQFAKLLYSSDAYLVTLDVEGKQASAIVQEAQFDKVSDQLLHVDFLEAVPGKYLTVKIPVVTTGAPPGVKKGGKLMIKIRRVTVKGLVDDLPDHITIDVSKLELGESIKVREMKFDKLKFLDPANAAIVAVRTTREADIPTAAKPGAVAAPVAGAPAAAGTPAAAEAKKDEKPGAKKEEKPGAKKEEKPGGKK